MINTAPSSYRKTRSAASSSVAISVRAHLHRIRSISSSEDEEENKEPHYKEAKRSCYFDDSYAVCKPTPKQIPAGREAGLRLNQDENISGTSADGDDEAEEERERTAHMLKWMDASKQPQGVHNNRAIAIKYIFEHVLGSPSIEAWDGAQGTIANIMLRLSIPEKSKRLVKKILMKHISHVIEDDIRGRTTRAESQQDDTES